MNSVKSILVDLLWLMAIFYFCVGDIIDGMFVGLNSDFVIFMAVSSASVTNKDDWFAGISIVHRRYSIEPKILPWGAPALVGLFANLLRLKYTWNFLPRRCDCRKPIIENGRVRLLLCGNSDLDTFEGLFHF